MHASKALLPTHHARWWSPTSFMFILLQLWISLAYRLRHFSYILQGLQADLSDVPYCLPSLPHHAG